MNTKEILTTTQQDKLIRISLVLLLTVYLTSCTSSKKDIEVDEEIVEVIETEEVIELEANQAELIMSIAMLERENPMYSRHHDSTYLYWLDSQLIILKNRTKCNIYAINVLHRAGFKTPNVNVLTHDLMDVSRFNDIFPVIRINDYDEIMKGDLVVWHGHVIIFESLRILNNKHFANAWWAGTRQKDNGDNIKNNVIFGRYPLEGNFIVRRPLFHHPGL